MRRCVGLVFNMTFMQNKIFHLRDYVCGLNPCQMNVQKKNGVVINTLYWNLRVGSLIHRQSCLTVWLTPEIS